jgi:hypothetical protein
VEREYPTELLSKCPESLPRINLSEEVWDGLSHEAEEELRDSKLAEWAETYHSCSSRHNLLVDEIEN